jgi:uncharacterized lipoprotein YmbA
MRRLALIALLGLVGCASQVTRHEAPAAKVEPVRAIASFDLTVSEQAKARIADTGRFDPAALRSTMQTALESRGLIAKDGDFELGVVVDDVRVRHTANAVLFGFMAGDDRIEGTVTVKRRDGSTAGSFAVKASYALGGFAGGIHATRVGWLYEEFSKKVAEELVARRDAKP